MPNYITIIFRQNVTTYKDPKWYWNYLFGDTRDLEKSTSGNIVYHERLQNFKFMRFTAFTTIKFERQLKCTMRSSLLRPLMHLDTAQRWGGAFHRPFGNNATGVGARQSSKSITVKSDRDAVMSPSRRIYYCFKRSGIIRAHSLRETKGENG